MFNLLLLASAVVRLSPPPETFPALSLHLTLDPQAASVSGSGSDNATEWKPKALPHNLRSLTHKPKTEITPLACGQSSYLSNYEEVMATMPSSSPPCPGHPGVSRLPRALPQQRGLLLGADGAGGGGDPHVVRASPHQEGGQPGGECHPPGQTNGSTVCWGLRSLLRILLERRWRRH